MRNCLDVFNKDHLKSLFFVCSLSFAWRFWSFLKLFFRVVVHPQTLHWEMWDPRHFSYLGLRIYPSVSSSRLKTNHPKLFSQIRVAVVPLGDTKVHRIIWGLHFATFITPSLSEQGMSGYIIWARLAENVTRRDSATMRDQKILNLGFGISTALKGVALFTQVVCAMYITLSSE